MEDLFIKDYTYELPNERIAAYPLPQRDASKLLVYKGGITDDHFSNLAKYIPGESLLVLNNSRVIHARMFFQKPTGGVIEIFCLEPFAPATTELAMMQDERVQWRCLIGGASKWKKGQVLEKKLNISGTELIFQARFTGREEDDFIIEFSWDHPIVFAELLHAAGTIPLPPYIKRTVDQSDEERYQTVFAQQQGSVAAPTASLHFTENIFKELEEKNVNRAYLTLHVGAGTFKPVKTDTIAAHQMHAESFSIHYEALAAIVKSSLIIAGGTTSLRALESLYWLGIKLKNGNEDFVLGQWDAYELEADLTYKESLQLLKNYLSNRHEKELHCRTSLLIRPGYNFRSADALITNFHQPGSTLLLLVAAFIGDDWKKVYDHALKNDYRFLSYGDSSLLWRK